MSKAAYYFVISILSCIIGMLIYTVIISFPLHPPIKVLINPIPIVGAKKFNPGQIVPLRFNYIRYTDKPLLTYRRFVNHNVIFTDEYSTVEDKGTFDRVSWAHRIPETLPVGDYRIRFTWVYPVSILRTIYVRAETEKFTVTTEPCK